MVERSRRGKRKKRPLTNHQRCWLWGRNLVRETLLAGRWTIVELLLADDLSVEYLEEAGHLAAGLHVKTQIVPAARLRELAHTSEHQGYLARMGPFPYVAAETLLADMPARPLYLILDSIQDPYNFGAIIRSAGAFGADGVFVARRGQAGVSSFVARSSAGVVNRVYIAQVDDLVALVTTLKSRGVLVIGASEKGIAPLNEFNFRGATAIVVGNEGTGISPDLIKNCDLSARIPLSGEVDSLNAAAAAAVMLYEVRGQRGS